MTGDERRQGIINDIMHAKEPISGTALAKKYEVSRQVIVQDIALLRAGDYEIFSTTKGYLLQQTEKIYCVVEVWHSDEQIEDELNAVVDMGGCVADVFVKHEIYGHLKAELNLASRKDVKTFVKGIASGQSRPLKNLTSGRHFHTIEAKTQEDLEAIIEELKEKGFLLGIEW